MRGDNMKINKTHSIDNKNPIENHQTAAWADIEKVQPESRVPIPSQEAVDRAKDWVEENEK
ncbi:MAG: DUF3787 domain-containing protein [Firmicutes bacterium HGW-Firmicutes-7]|nr:MAG: DUF3787 domain-containing protein [Firmicutes bacterium HGW-Firmicutes-7]